MKNKNLNFKIKRKPLKMGGEMEIKANLSLRLVEVEAELGNKCGPLLTGRLDGARQKNVVLFRALFTINASSSWLWP